MIRLPLASDQAYVASTWARSVLSVRAGHFERRHGSRDRLVRSINPTIDAVMDRRDSRVLIYADADAIIGWVAFVDGAPVPIVHYLYTRNTLRRQGIATALLDRIGIDRARPVVCTSDGPMSSSLRARYRLAVYLPLTEFLAK